MFEYAISAGEGTLLKYGVAKSPIELALLQDDPNLFGVDHDDNGDVVFALYAMDAEENRLSRKTSKIMRFKSASPDCQTGQ